MLLRVTSARAEVSSKVHIRVMRYVDVAESFADGTLGSNMEYGATATGFGASFTSTTLGINSASSISSSSWMTCVTPLEEL